MASFDLVCVSLSSPRWGPSEVCSRHTHLLASLVSLLTLPALSLLPNLLL